MRYEIDFTREASEDMRGLHAHVRSAVLDTIKKRLRYEPLNVTQTSVKRLRDLESPQFRLRVGDVRVFYDVAGSRVLIHAIVRKSEAAEWLRERGRRR